MSRNERLPSVRDVQAQVPYFIRDRVRSQRVVVRSEGHIDPRSHPPRLELDTGRIPLRARDDATVILPNPDARGEHYGRLFHLNSMAYLVSREFD